MKNGIIPKIEHIIANSDASESETLQKIKYLYDSEMSNRLPDTPANSISHLLAEQLTAINSGQHPTGLIQTGFAHLDNLIGGFREGELVVVGGRPSMGSTQLLINMAIHISQTHPMLYLSYDLSEQVFTCRFLATLSNIETNKILQCRLSDDEKSQLAGIASNIEKYRLLVSAYPSTSIDWLNAYCAKQAKEKGIRVVMVNCIQALSSEGFRGKKHIEIEYICGELKKIARENNICVIASSQLNRGVENRTGLQNKRPELHDLRDSGAIEEAADKVIFIHRPEYYGFDIDDDGNSLENIAEVIVAKNRNGAIGDILLKKAPGFTSFVDFDHYSNLSFDFGERLHELGLPESTLFK